ncbi:putative glycolipid-binding domain-containing protein [Burkholderia sp. SCN-KJ]|uniref:putative glycolipid-binding domain-containing protein n=1 Tax=Burkholderia sp. SCN-KJ TaxID=2969248 RepID=UPI00214F919E|nr:putative glycolipid-binding domain-containing protein [Burkholderia sp. SCN-KJ]MCR4470338.1 putative glycolipid-binding domain-containing protein [Burkholderia sp. SCN-KJ]
MTQRDEAARTRCVAWQIAQTWQAAEWCRLAETRAGIDLSGTVAGALDGTPFRFDYAIVCGADWLTRSVRVTYWLGAAPPRQLAIECDAGHWTIDGGAAAALAGATDIDLGFSPSTNTLPIRRLGLAVGASAVIRTAWLRFPSFEIVRGEQRYARTAEHVYRYESGAYAADIAVDDAGLVTDYDEWRRIGATRAP